MTLGEVLIWLIIGGFVGSFVGMLMTRTRKGYGRFANLVLGTAGGVAGGALFELLGIDLGLGDLSVSFEDLIAAFLGSLLLLALLWGFRRLRRP